MDWLDAFMAHTSGVPSPEIYRLWSGISCLSGALERRVWVNTARSLLYPNLFVLLVGSPGQGKTQAINPVGDLWSGVKGLKTSPDNVTKASLIDSLKDAQRIIMLPSGSIAEFHSLAVACSELGVFLTAHDLEFLSVLNHVYDNPRHYKETRRSLKQEIDISHPQMTILAGAQPDFLNNLLPDEAWGMGFCSRIIMIYSGSTPVVDLFDDAPLKQKEFDALLTGLNEMMELYGPFHWDDDAKVQMSKFNSHRKETDPEHSKLSHYNARRVLHSLKLTQIAAVSARQELRIKSQDVDRALDWLFHAEHQMPDVFREMSKKSDADIIMALHHFMWKIWVKERKPFHQARIYNFLKDKVPAEKAYRVFEIAEKSHIIQRLAGTDQYVPLATEDHGLE